MGQRTGRRIRLSPFLFWLRVRLLLLSRIPSFSCSPLSLPRPMHELSHQRPLRHHIFLEAAVAARRHRSHVHRYKGGSSVCRCALAYARGNIRFLRYETREYSTATRTERAKSAGKRQQDRTVPCTSHRFYILLPS